MDLGLKGRVAIVTGATRGIGLATTVALAREGAKVSICARGLEGLRLAADQVKAAGSDCLTFQCDLGADRDAAQRFVDATLAEFGRLDSLVVSHGVHTIKEFADLTDDEWRKAFDDNFFGVVRICRAAIPHMQQRKWGRVVLVSAGSIHRQSIGPDVHPHYTTAKAAVANLGKFLSKQYAPDNVMVNTVLPAYSMKPMAMARYRKMADDLRISENEAFLREANSIGFVPAVLRPGKPEEFGDIIAFLASEKASYMSGVEVPIDGGGLDWP